MRPRLSAIVVALAASAPVISVAQDETGVRRDLEATLRRFFAADRPTDASMRDLLVLAKGRDDLLSTILLTKSFQERMSSSPPVRRGVIDSAGRFRDVADGADAESRRPRDDTGNAALLSGPSAPAGLVPFVVYVPDSTSTDSYEHEVAREGAGRGRFVLLVPDEKRDNRWNPTQQERRRHVGPIRELLLACPIDPDRVLMVGSGRGGHATWDVGLTYADRWAGLFPCNGGLIHEGGYKASGGVFLQNAKSLVVHTVYNTSFDHGIDGCRLAGKKFKEWGYRFDAVEEPTFRTMQIAEAMEKLGTAARDAHPREIVKRFNHLDAAEHFWLRALDRVPREWDPSARIAIHGKWPDDPAKQREAVWEQVKSECAFLEAKVRDNRFDVTAKGIGHLRVYLDPALVDYKAKVTVAINGKVRAPFLAEKKTENLLRHVHETGDTARLYWAFRDFPVDE